MGKNRFENFIFSLVICFLMVLGMTLYNGFLHTTNKIGVFGSLISLQFLTIFIVAFIIDWFAVAPIVKKLVANITTDKTPFIKKIMLISTLMVLFMCTAMSLVATFVQGYEGSLLNAYAHSFALNLIFALPLQFFVVGPIARSLFFKVFPQPTLQTAN
ncbi:DUF2798 domain-containing protein [Vibrio algarum]|uniref:DUF2798 domain-containing protein n=1 Tax=Vibrio algarum TaxID=3020714 RepID=A0ABT4YWL5_9VIBR|nr:DUF2798 domain-containing protein [Vibrio sp. KJ40-1]MDB1125982.1 DUF2798 domain-containing protein [Vibrio sp. KJ40-1]